MKPIEITTKRSFFIWLSFMWRSVVLTIPSYLILFPLFLWLIPTNRNGESGKILEPISLSSTLMKFFLMWTVMMILMVITQTFAMKWTMKNKWSDFRIIGVSDNENDENNV